MGGGNSKQINSNNSDSNKKNQEEDLNVQQIDQQQMTVNDEDKNTNNNHNIKNEKGLNIDLLNSNDNISSASIKTPNKRKSVHGGGGYGNGHKLSNFQTNIISKPEKGFRIRESKNSALQVDDDDENSDVGQKLSEQHEFPSNIRSRRKKQSKYILQKQQQLQEQHQNMKEIKIGQRISRQYLAAEETKMNTPQITNSGDSNTMLEVDNYEMGNVNQKLDEEDYIKQQQQKKFSHTLNLQTAKKRERNSSFLNQSEVYQQNSNDNNMQFAGYNTGTNRQQYSPVKLQKNKQIIKQQIIEPPSPELPRSKSGLVGLKNIGNTCFMNSTLQCMFNLPQFNQIFLSNSYKKQLKSKNKGLAKSYAEIILKIRKAGNSGAENPANVKKAIEQYSAQFSGQSQQDASELLVTLLTGLHDELNRGKKPQYKELDADLKKKTLQQISDEWFQYYKIQDDSHIQDFFCGQLISTVKCIKCGNESIACDNFHDLSLSFSRAIRMVEDPQIERLFSWYLAEEQLDDEYYCSKCKNHRKCTRNLKIWKLPNILVIHLKRFHYGRTKREKINNKIKFPIKNLDLSDYTQESTDPTSEDCLYDLVGIVNHMGNLYGGHYVSNCKNPIDKRWYQFNDSQVSEIDINQEAYETTGSSSPYLLFYAKKELLKSNNPLL